MRSRKTYLTVFDASDFRQLPTGEWFSENPGKPIKQVPIGDPFKYIASQGWIVRVTDDLDKVFKQVKNMHKAGKIAQYGAEGMNESKQGVAEGLRVDVPNEDWLDDAIAYAKQKSPDRNGLPYMGKTTATVRKVEVPVGLLKRIPGMRNEQQNVRQHDLAAIMKIMKDTENYQFMLTVMKNTSHSSMWPMMAVPGSTKAIIVSWLRIDWAGLHYL
jgi:hypothetical protein